MKSSRGHLQKTVKKSKVYQSLDFRHLKIVHKRLGIFPILDNIFTAFILGMREKREREFTTHVELLLLSEPISQYSSKNLPETDDNDGTHKNDANMLS